MLMYLDTPDPGSLSNPSLLNSSSFSCGLSKSMRFGLRGRGEWSSACPLRALVSTEVDSAIMKSVSGACCLVCADGAALWEGCGQPKSEDLRLDWVHCFLVPVRDRVEP